MFGVARARNGLVLAGVWLTVAWVMPDSLLHSPNSDPDGYLAFARTWSTHGVYGPSENAPSAYRPPGYPLLLVPLTPFPQAWAWLVLGLHLLAGWGTLILAIALARRCGGDRWAGMAGWLVAVDPLLARQAGLVMTETVFAFLLTAMVLGWLRLSRQPSPDNGSAILLGLLVGGAALVRPIAWPCWLAIGLVALWQGKVKAWLWALLAALAVTTPWAVRNQLVLGAPILTTTHGGYTLWLGQNPDYYREVVEPGAGVWPPDGFRAWTAENERSTKGLDERARDRFYRARAIDWMRAHPLPSLHSMVAHVRSLWSPAPNYGPHWARWLCGIYYGAVFFLAAFGLARASTWRPPTVVLPMMLLVFTAVHALYWSDARMRTPMVACLAVLATLGTQRLDALARRKGTP